MKNPLKTMIVTLFSLSFASGAFGASQSMLEWKVGNSSRLISGLIKEEMEKHTDYLGELKNFTVDYRGLKCVEAQPSEFDPEIVGGCVVPASAMHATAQFIIIAKQDGFEVRALYVDVE